nr:MAG TPA: hypothetical protein [Caudoviricetes sp.]
MIESILVINPPARVVPLLSSQGLFQRLYIEDRLHYFLFILSFNTL